MIRIVHRVLSRSTFAADRACGDEYRVCPVAPEDVSSLQQDVDRDGRRRPPTPRRIRFEGKPADEIDLYLANCTVLGRLDALAAFQCDPR